MSKNQTATLKTLEVPYNKAEQDCVAMAYLEYVEQAIEVPTQLDGAYDVFTYDVFICCGL